QRILPVGLAAAGHLARDGARLLGVLRGHAHRLVRGQRRWQPDLPQRRRLPDPRQRTVESPIAVSGRSGNAPASTPVAVDIRHTYRGDLKVDLVAPDGSVYMLHNRSGGGADNLIGTYNVNLSSEARNGTWRLRVNDNWSGDTGYINSWSITF